MGAGTSAEQVADKPKEEEAEQSNDLEQEQQDGQGMEVDAAGDIKLLHKNGKFTILNGTAEGEETVEVIIQAEDLNVFQEKEIAKEVEQTEPAKVTLNGEQEENMEVASSDTMSKENTKEDGQAETPEINATTPVSEEKAESPEQSNENQSSEVGFKKVFKFVGFKFTVKKDKSEKSEPVQLLTVKKDEAEVNGTTSQEEHINAAAAAEGKAETQQETKEDVQQAESPDGAPQAVESPAEVPEEAQNKEEVAEVQTKKEPEPEVEKDKKSPESPTNTVVTETSSPFKRFFTQGWAGLRKKTSFRKSKEEDPQEVEKYIKGEEQEKTEATETVKEEGESAKETVEEQTVVPEESSKSASEEPKSSKEEDSHVSVEETKADESLSDQPEDQKPEETVKADEGAVQVTEEKESLPEIVTSAPSISDELKAETDTLEIQPENQIIDVLSPSSVEVPNESQTEIAPTSEEHVSDQSELHSSTESAEKGQEVITTEAELLSSQEKVKAQGSPLKKLFSSSGLRKLSGKKSKGKKDDDAKADVAAEPAPASCESPETAEVNGGDSSPSSPDESAETSPTEKPVEEEPHAADLEGEGATSDGERKKDGITPWASFKKLVTPKRRPKRLSESDKEDEVEKAKTSTLSSTDSGGSVENPEEIKEPVEEQKLEKSTEENKKKADSSVSWDALICVGSSKKRARKTSDSDEEEIQKSQEKSQEESKKNDGETVQTKEPESESPITSSQEQQVQDSPSPDQASSPTEGDGVSTWQSFKRLVTPRRKSKTKAEEKIEETAAVSNPEQSTSEGEGSKEESWVSFKKLIPGRRKKKSDAKQEQAPPSADQPVQESTEDDSDEPAVVPLAEFDAAELEKLNAQKSVVVSGAADVSGEQKESLEKPSDELIHAVTVTFIEGERAVTSLEERAPSWISAKVTEAIEHAKEVEETTETITVEQTVVFSSVSQVMAETQSTLINEVELTSEALTALEEAIETSCAEETTEMLSAVSQLGESVLSTEQATPVPEDDARVQTLQEQKQFTDNILHAVAESAKLSCDVINSASVNVSPNVKEELQETNLEQSATTLAKDIFTKLVEDQKPATSVVEKHIEEVINAVTEKVAECIPTSLDETVQVRSEGKVNESTVEHIMTVDKDHSVSEKLSESFCVSTNNQDTEGAFISIDEKVDKPVLYASLEKSAEDFKKSAKVIEETLDIGETKAKVEEQITELETAYNELSSREVADPFKGVQNEDYDSVSVSLLDKKSEVDIPTVGDSGVTNSFENQLHADESTPLSPSIQSKEGKSVPTEVQTEISVPISSDREAKESHTVSSELQENAILESDVKRIEESAPISAELQFKDIAVMPLEVESNVWNEKCVPMATEVTVQEGALAMADEMQAEESTLVATEVEAKEGDLVLPEVQTEEVVTLLTEMKDEESASLLAELKAEQTDTVSPVSQAEESAPVSFEVQTEESCVLQKQSTSVPPEVQTEEGVPVPAEVKAEESDAMSHEIQAEESAPVPPEVKVEEDAPMPSEVQVEKAVAVPPELQAEEAAPLPAEVRAEDAATLPSEVQTEEIVSVPAEIQAEEVAPVSSEVHAEDTSSLAPEVQAEEDAPVPPEVKAEEATPVPTEVPATGEVAVTAEMQDVHVLPEIKSEESFPVLTKPNAECVPVPSEVQADKGMFVLTEVQPAEDAKVTIEMQTEEGVPILTEVQTAQDDTVTTAVQAEECVTILAGENVSLLTGVQTEEGDLVSTEVATEDVSVSDEFKVFESVSVSKEEQGEFTALSSEVKIKEGAPVLPEKNAETDITVSTELQVGESHSACVEGQAKEAISVSDKDNIEDSTLGLVEGLAEEVILVEEQAKGEVLLVEHAPVSAEEQDNKDVPISKDAQTEDVSILSQVEESITTSDKKKADKDVSDELQTQEYVSDVQTENRGQTEESNLVSDMVKVISVVDDHLGSTSTPGETVNVKDTQVLDEETKESGEFFIEKHEDKVDSGSLSNVVNQLEVFQEVAEVKEEIITTDIPEFETSEARNASEPVTAAAVEEKMLAETVKPIETPSDCIQIIEKPDLNLQSEHHTENPEELPTLVTSVSQKAAAIVDAAIEAATNCFVVDASSQDETAKGTTLKHQTEETIVEANNTKTSITTTVHITVETTVEKVKGKMYDRECVSNERQNQEDKFVSQVQEPEHEPIDVLSTSAQTKGIKTDDKNEPSYQECVVIPSTDLVDSEPAGITLNVEEESKPSPISIQEDIHKTSIQTDSSTDTQEKAQLVES